MFHLIDNKCKNCGNRYHWSNAFRKFGYDDGDGDVQTHLVAKVLEDAGYEVQYSRWSPHNTIIYSIKKCGVELMPLEDLSVRIGYDDPEEYLPDRVSWLLDSVLENRAFECMVDLQLDWRISQKYMKIRWCPKLKVGGITRLASRGHFFSQFKKFFKVDLGQDND